MLRKHNAPNNASRKPMISRLRDLVAGDGGFTLLETLAVMVIVGLLAAITVPQISKWREKAYVTSIKTDARNVASAIEAAYVDDQVYPATATSATTPSLLQLQANIGVKLSDGNTLTSYTNNGTSFTFVITSSKVAATGQDVGTYVSNRATGSLLALT
jgi:prepilin-type N-terminal cleavage/methylation domain-containing protein